MRSSEETDLPVLPGKFGKLTLEHLLPVLSSNSVLMSDRLSNATLKEHTSRVLPCTFHSPAACPAAIVPGFCTRARDPGSSPVAAADSAGPAARVSALVAVTIQRRCTVKSSTTTTYSVVLSIFLEQLPPQRVLRRLLHEVVERRRRRQRGHRRAGVVSERLGAAHDRRGGLVVMDDEKVRWASLPTATTRTSRGRDSPFGSRK